MGITVIKGNGERVLFEAEKLKKALANSGANTAEQERIAKQLEPRLYEGITTRKIYQMAHALLRKQSNRLAGRYRLKKAIMELGPTGYPFEHLVGKLFELEGYEVETGVMVQGKCVQHEVDVVARKGNEMIIIECKFHSDNSRKCNVQVPLYIQSRFLDVKAAWEKTYGKNISYKGGVVTNTRFSDDATSFAECVGLRLVSWDYPGSKALKYWIDKSGFHPLTSLHALNKKQKQLLLEEGIVLCREIVEQKDLLSKIGIPNRQAKKILTEAENLIME